MKPALLALILLAFAAPAQAQVQTWPPRPAGPIDDAARARQDRERWRAGLDARAAEVRTQQLQTDLTVYRLQTGRGPIVAPPEGPVVDGGPLPGLITASEGERQTMSEAQQRLDAMDNWAAGRTTP